MVGLGILSADYERSSSINGMARKCKGQSAVESGLTGAECPGCHIGYFAPNFIALSPPLPVLDYIHSYLVNTPTADQRPVHEVCVALLKGYGFLDLTKLAWLGVRFTPARNDREQCRSAQPDTHFAISRALHHRNFEARRRG